MANRKFHKMSHSAEAKKELVPYKSSNPFRDGEKFYDPPHFLRHPENISDNLHYRVLTIALSRDVNMMFHCMYDKPEENMNKFELELRYITLESTFWLKS